MKKLNGHSPKDTDGQKAHDKVLNITNYYRNENQNNNEVIPHVSQNGHHKNLQTINVGKGVEKMKLS